MAKVVEHTVTKGDYVTKWRLGAPDNIEVDVYKNGVLVLEWVFPCITGKRLKLCGNAAIFFEQALLYAETEGLK